jgi:hypothetical protein
LNTKKQSSTICLVLLGVFAASCGLGQSSGAAVATVTTTSTASSTPLPTLTQTSTPSPTPSTTPVPVIGEPLRSDNWEATVLEAVYRKSISIAGTVYISKPGSMGFDVIMKVKNLNPTLNPSTLVKNVLVVDEQGNAWLAVCWGRS